FFGTSKMQAQIGDPFQTRYTENVRGDLTIIGNSSLNRSGTRPTDDPGPTSEGYDGSGNNHDSNVNMQYVDIDGDPSTFSSSSAQLIFPTAEFSTASECFNIVYAG